MVKEQQEVVKLAGAQHFRQRLLLATLAGKTLRIDEIRSRDSVPGLRDYEASFLRLLEKISNGCIVEINETGTMVYFFEICVFFRKFSSVCLKFLRAAYISLWYMYCIMW